MSIARRLLIAGAETQAGTGGSVEDLTPCNGEVGATVQAAGGEDVVGAIDAAGAVDFSSFMSSRQICMCSDRVIVEERIPDPFLEKLVAKAASLSVGDPSEPHNVIGPMINEAAAERVHGMVQGDMVQGGMVQSAMSQGARLAFGGTTPDGALTTPTVLPGVTTRMAISQEEIFGPVCCVETARGEDHAIELANSANYGLSAGVFSEDIRRGYRVATRLRTGIVHVNDQSVDDESQAPVGGVGDSGYGKFGGQAGIDSFTTLRWLTMQMGRREFPF